MEGLGWKRAVALAAAGATVAGGAGEAQGRVRGTGTSAASPYKVGVVYSRTGLFAAYGAEYLEGLKLGLKYATHGTNKVSGHPIQLTMADDATTPATGVSAAKDLIGQGYKILMGSESSGVAAQIAPLADQNHVLFISGPAAADVLTGINRYTFRSGRPP